MSPALSPALDCFLSTSDASAACQHELHGFIVDVQTSLAPFRAAHRLAVLLRHELVRTQRDAGARLFTVLLLLEALARSRIFKQSKYMYVFDSPKLANALTWLLFAPGVSHRVRLKVLHVCSELYQPGMGNVGAILATANKLGLHIPSQYSHMDGKVSIQRVFGLSIFRTAETVCSEVRRRMKHGCNGGDNGDNGDNDDCDVKIYVATLKYLALKLRNTKGGLACAMEMDRVVEKAEMALYKEECETTISDQVLQAPLDAQMSAFGTIQTQANSINNIQSIRETQPMLIDFACESNSQNSNTIFISSTLESKDVLPLQPDNSAYISLLNCIKQGNANTSLQTQTPFMSSQFSVANF